MENIINRIISIDENAKERLSEAEERRKSILASAEQEKQGIIRKNLGKAQTTLIRMDDFEKHSSEDRIAAINKAAEEKIARLNRLYEDNHLIWEDEIVGRITAQDIPL